MIYKLVVLNIFCSKVPCNLTIMSENGSVLKRVEVNSHCSKICICTKGRRIRLSASYSRQQIYKTIYLGCARQQNIFVNFAFNLITLQKYVCFVKLNDRNYGFPVKNANLLFNHH